MRARPNTTTTMAEDKSIAKFSEWSSLYHLSSNTIQALVSEGVNCEEALTGLKESELDELKSKYWGSTLCCVPCGSYATLDEAASPHQLALCTMLR